MAAYPAPTPDEVLAALPPVRYRALRGLNEIVDKIEDERCKAADVARGYTYGRGSTTPTAQRVSPTGTQRVLDALVADGRVIRVETTAKIVDATEARCWNRRGNTPQVMYAHPETVAAAVADEIERINDLRLERAQEAATARLVAESQERWNGYVAEFYEPLSNAPAPAGALA